MKCGCIPFDEYMADMKKNMVLTGKHFFFFDDEDGGEDRDEEPEEGVVVLSLVYEGKTRGYMTVFTDRDLRACGKEEVVEKTGNDIAEVLKGYEFSLDNGYWSVEIPDGQCWDDVVAEIKNRLIGIGMQEG